jgi:aromatic-L-amino-acid decarboxylase
VEGFGSTLTWSGCVARLMAKEMFRYDEAMTDLILAACRERLSMDPVALDFGGLVASLGEELDGLMRPEGNEPADVLKVFVDKLSTAVVSCDSPRFLSFIPAAPTKAALLFDMFVSCCSLHGTSWLEAAGVVVAENQALRVLAQRAGFPEEAGGCFVAGGSAGNLSALMVARDTAAHRRGAAAPEHPLVAISEDAHSSVGKALRVLGIGALTVPTPGHRLTGGALAAALGEDARGADVIGVVATAGTTNAGIVDDLNGIADVAAEHSLWYHIDGAYGGAAALFAPSQREAFAGFERADSFIVDPHKWLFAPFDCAALIYRQPNLAKAVHTQDAQYLDVLHSGKPDEWNPSDYAFHLTRRARGLPLWFSMAVNGLDAYCAAVQGGLDIAQRAAERIEASPLVELVREPGLSIVLFRRLGWDKLDYDAWSARLLHDQIGFVTPTTWEGETVARFAFLHPHATVQMIDEILGSMAEA